MLLKAVDIEKVEVGDTFVRGSNRFAITSIEDESYGRELRYKDADGINGVHLVALGEQVSIEL